MKRRALLGVLPSWLVAACSRIPGLNLSMTKVPATVPTPTSKPVPLPSATPSPSGPTPTAVVSINPTPKPLASAIATPAIVTPTPNPTSLSQGTPTAISSAVNNPFVGSAVSTYTGEYFYSWIDTETGGSLPGLQFRRSYNSGDKRVSPLGPGWTHSYNLQIVRSPGIVGVVVLGAQGRIDHYTPSHQLSVGDAFDPPPGVTSRLVLEPNGFSLTQPDGRKFTFDQPGILQSDQDPSGKVTVLTHDSKTGVLTTIADPSGRGLLSLAYDAAGRLTSLSDWLTPARVVRYGYDDQGRLSSVTDREGQQTRYAYLGNTSLLASITDANGNVSIRNVYDSQSRNTARRDARAGTANPGITLMITPNAMAPKRR